MLMGRGSLGEAIVSGSANRPCSSTRVRTRCGRTVCDGSCWSRPELRAWAEEILAVLMGERLAADPTLHPHAGIADVDVALGLARGWCGVDQRAAAGSPPESQGFAVRPPAGRERPWPMTAWASTPQVVRTVTGHSAGLVSAWVTARHGSVPSPEAAARGDAGVLGDRRRDGAPRLDRGRCQGARRPPARRRGRHADARRGWSDRTAPAVAARTHGGATVEICLQNCGDRWVLGGPAGTWPALPSDLADEAGVESPSSSPPAAPTTTR